MARKKNTTKRTARGTQIKWACPECGMDHTGKHKISLKKPECKDGLRPVKGCGGFVCECEDSTPKDHGDSLEKPCPYAVCYHCGYAGQFPPLPRKLTGWEKKAAEAGWTPPGGWKGEKIDWRDKYARKVTEANDYRGYLEHICKFLKESWEELPNQDGTDPADRFGDFCPEYSETCQRVGRNWCPSLIEELGEILEPGTEWVAADI